MSLSDTALVTLIQAKNYIRIDAAASLNVAAEYVGIGDGGTKEFTLDHTPIEGSLKLYVDGSLQTEGTDFTISSATITFTSAPENNKPITAAYDYAAGDDTFESYDDELLEIFIEAATKKAEEYTGRAFVEREIIETHIGNDTKYLKLRRQPVSSVSTVTIDDTAITDYEERLNMGRLYREGTWPLNYEVDITYTAGYGADRVATQALIPDAVLGVLIAVAVWYNNRLGLVSENISGVGSVNYGSPDELPPAAKKRLDSLSVNLI